MSASSTRMGSRRSVLLRMAKDQARAERIRALKDANPEITWDEIADYVGVSARAANAWAAHGGIAPQNARRLAEFFSVDYELLYRGPVDGSPDLMAVLAAGKGPTQLDDIERKLDEVLSRLSDPATQIEQGISQAHHQAPTPTADTETSARSARPQRKAR